VGGELGRDGSGRLDGWLYEQSFLGRIGAAVISAVVPGLGMAPLVDALVEENQFLHSTGITRTVTRSSHPESGGPTRPRGHPVG